MVKSKRYPAMSKAKGSKKKGYMSAASYVAKAARQGVQSRPRGASAPARSSGPSISIPNIFKGNSYQTDFVGSIKRATRQK